MLEAKISLALTEQLSVLSVSKSIEDLLGFSVDDFMSGKISLKKLIHPHDLDISDALFSPASHHASGTFNIRLRQASGRIRCIRGSYEKRSGEGGSDPSLDLLLQDAKSLKRTLDEAGSVPNFRAIMDNTDDYIYFKDRNHVFTGASQTLVSLCHPAEHWSDLIGQTDYDVFPEEYADIYYRLEKQVFSGIAIAHEIQETLTKDGKRGWVDNRKYPIKNEHGEIIGLYGIARDITARVEAAQKLLESEEKFRTVADYTYGWEVWEDAHGSCRYCSPSCERVTGYSADAFKADPGLLERLIHPDDLSKWTAHHVAVHSAAEKQEAVAGCANELEFRLLNIHGEVRWVHHLCHHIHDAEGHDLGHRISNRDITERKRAEARLASLSHILENSLNEIYIFDAESLKFLFVNKGALKNTGFTHEEMLALTPVDIKLEYSRESFLVALQPLLNGQTEILKFATVHKRKNGTLYNVEIHLQLGSYEEKKVFVAIILDITERRRLEAEVAKTRNLESLAILAGGIAHDFNNLFQVLLGNIQLAKMNTPASSKAFPFLEKVEEAYEVATKLTSKLIAFSPGGSTHPITIQSATIIKEEVLSALEGSGLVAEFDLAENLWFITADPPQFRTVIKQMVLNAREAMSARADGKLMVMAVNESLAENHGKHPSLCPGSYVKISIKDQGAGIPKEDLPHIFDPYFSTKQRGTRKGMGLGLTLCDTIIRKHGGAITVESELGKGTTFHIYLPAVVAGERRL